ncbi:MAG: T9SS type A sorting domain-containing protein [Bacteroidota bacterium]|nr:T9SS type A sorting domain-containing protein [Bacteroidota bacterium]
MKNLNTLLHLVFLIFFLVPCLANAQSSEALAKFHVSENENSFLISWTIKAGFSCSDVMVEHSSDGINYNPVYRYPGVCGIIGSDETYSFIHKAPMNGANYYKMDLGYSGNSEPLSVNFVDTRINGFVIYPMPIQDHSKIAFTSGFLAFSLMIINHSGMVVYREDNIRGSEFPLGKLGLEKGIYHFTLKNGNVSYSGTFIR